MKKLNLLTPLIPLFAVAVTPFIALADSSDSLAGINVNIEAEKTASICVGESTGVIRFATNCDGSANVMKFDSSGLDLGTLPVILPNSVYLKARNAAGTANIDILKVDATDDTVLDADSGDFIRFANAGTTQWTLSATNLSPSTTNTESIGAIGAAAAAVYSNIFQGDTSQDLDINARNGNIYFGTVGSDTAPVRRWSIGTAGDFIGQTATNNIIRTASADASDSSSILLYSAGAGTTGRGAQIGAYGNEYGSSVSGDVDLRTGDAAAAEISLRAVSTTGQVRIYTNGADRWVFNQNGDLVSSGAAAEIITSTSDGSDSSALRLGGGGAYSDTGIRGASISLKGNENTAAGDLLLLGGSADGSVVTISTNQANGLIYFNTGAAANALTLTAAQAATFTGVVTSTRTTDLGWTPVAAANQACNTTCTSACVYGIDSAAPHTWLACTDATADMCLCAGAS